MTLSPRVVPRGLLKYFRTRLSDREAPDPFGSARVVSVIAMGRGTNRHVTDSQSNFSRSPSLRRLAPSSSPQAMTSPAVGNSPRPSQQGDQPRRQGRPRALKTSARPDRDDYDPQRRPRRHLRGGACSRRPSARGPAARRHRGGPEPFQRAPARPAIEDDGGLRTSGQRVDRSRKTASARPLRDLIAA